MNERNSFEILCATMNQKDLSLIQRMNINSNVVFANQCDKTTYIEGRCDDKHYAKMISTETIGVGVNRNLALLYSSASFCLFSDDDVTYLDNMEELVLEEFKKYKNADIIIFHFNSDSKSRSLKCYSKTHRVSRCSRKPWATFQIAFKRDAVIKHNIFFTTLFGGGAKYPCGEDTQWIMSAFKKRLKVYVSQKTIGTVSFKKSTWFSGYNESYYYGQGAAYQSHNKNTLLVWLFYVAIKTYKKSNLSFFECLRWMLKGANGYKKLLSFEEFLALEAQKIKK